MVVWDGVWLNPEEGNQKLKLQCAQGHLINTRPFYLRQGVWCTGCYVESLRDSLHSMQALAAKRKGGCLSSEYLNSRSKLLWQCEQGHVWEATSDFVKAGNWCSICYLQHKNANYLNKIKRIAEQHGGKCLSDVYVNTKTKLKFRCAKGHEWEATPAHVKMTTWCPECFYLSQCRSDKTRKKYLPSKK